MTRFIFLQTRCCKEVIAMARRPSLAAAPGQGRAGFSPLGLGPSAFARGGAGVPSRLHKTSDGTVEIGARNFTFSIISNVSF